MEENEQNSLLRDGEAEPLPLKVEIAPESKPKEEEKPQLVSVGQLFRFYDKFDLVLMTLGTIGAILYGAIIPGQFILMGKLTDEIVQFVHCQTGTTNCTALPDIEGSITKIAVWYVGIGLMNTVLAWVCLGLWGVAAERQVHKMRMVLFRNIINQEIGWFDSNPSGELNTRMTEDLNKIADGIGSKFGRLISCLFTFAAGYGIGFYYSWKMTLVMMTLLPMVMISGGMIAKIVGSFTAKELSCYAKAGNVAEQSFSSIRTVVAFGGEQIQVNKYDEYLVDACHFGIKKGFGTGLGMSVFQVVLFMNYALSFWFGIKLIRDGEITSGDVITVFFAVFMGSMTLGQAGPSGQALAASRGAGFTVFNLLERKSQIDPSSTEGSKPDNIEGNIEFRNVQFHYPSRETSQILKGVNLTIPSGKRVALVGESGCGKSTVVKLIQRFYDATEGSVLIDGQDIKSINVKHLRNFIGVVNQEPVLFATTISENIAYGREGVTQEEIEEASKMANAHDFITHFPQGYETQCGERGVQMSGGQKQRIAIARALVRNPKILLLDEATSALDTESEAVVQEALDKAGEDRTTVIVAHRLSTIKDADTIVAVKEGSVAESGSHNELMKLDGIYKNLVEMQKMIEEETFEGDDDDDDDDDDDEEEQEEHCKTFGSSHRLSAKGGYSMESLGSVATVSEMGDKQKDPPVKFSKLLKMNFPEWREMAMGCFGALLYGAYPFLFGLCFGKMFTTLSYDASTSEGRDNLKRDGKWWAAIWVAIGIESGLGCLLQYWMLARSGEHLTRRLRKRAFSAFLRQDMKYFDQPENGTGALCSRLATEVSAVQGATGSQLGLIISGIVTIIGCLLVAFLSSWKIALIILAFLPFLFLGGTLSMMFFGSKTRSADNDDPGQILEDTLANIHTVTSLSLQRNFYEKYHHSNEHQHSQAKRRAHLDGIFGGISMGIVNFSFAAAFWYGGKLVSDGELTIAQMMTTVFSVIMGAVTVGQIYSMTPNYGKARDAAKKLLQLLDQVPHIDSYSDGGIRPESCEGAVELASVRFRYPTRRNMRVLRGLDINAKPGQIIALVGSSGCGKSTSVSLVERFYDVKRGHVRVDGNDIKTLNLKWLRGQMGIVSQVPVLFNITIKENIAYGDTTREVADKEIEEAAKIANIHEFILSLPKGYDTIVGDKGTLISGGQKQRIAIARALIRDPKILFLDEATSALDTESEKVVQQALDKASVGRTTLVIAHRLSTIQNADQIIVIKRGRKVEEGTHNQLLALKGVYHALYKAQLKSDDDNDITIPESNLPV